MKEDVNNLTIRVNNAERLKELRKSRRESQAKFWKRFGVTQSRGSRFEKGLEIPASVAILVKLYLDGKVNDNDLWRVRRGIRQKHLMSFKHDNHAHPNGKPAKDQLILA